MEIDRIDLASVEAEVRAELDAKYAARELAIRLARPIIQHSSKAIRALHRNDEALAREFLDKITTDLAELNAGLIGQDDIARSGLVYDAVKEYAEAELTAALLARPTACRCPRTLGSIACRISRDLVRPWGSSAATPRLSCGRPDRDAERPSPTWSRSWIC